MPVHSSHAASNAHLLRTLRRLKAKVTTAEAAYLTALNSNKEVWIRVHDPVTRQSSLESRGTVKEYYEELQERAQALLPALAGLPRQGLTNEQDAEAKEIVHAWSEFTRQGAGHELYKSREGVATAQRAVLGEYATMMHSRTERTGRKGRQGLVKTVNKALKKMRAALEPLDERVRSEMMDQFNIIDILRYYLDPVDRTDRWYSGWVGQILAISTSGHKFAAAARVCGECAQHLNWKQVDNGEWVKGFNMRKWAKCRQAVKEFDEKKRTPPARSLTHRQHYNYITRFL